MTNNTTIPVPSLLSPEDICKVLGYGLKSIYYRSCYKPDTLPPRFPLPDSSLLRWHPEVVRRWIDERAGLIAPTNPPPSPPRRRPGRPTKAEQIERDRMRGGAK